MFPMFGKLYSNYHNAYHAGNSMSSLPLVVHACQAALEWMADYKKCKPATHGVLMPARAWTGWLASASFPALESFNATNNSLSGYLPPLKHADAMPSIMEFLCSACNLSGNATICRLREGLPTLLQFVILLKLQNF